MMTLISSSDIFANAIQETVGNAHAAAKAGRIEEALQWFSLCRTMLVERAPKATLEHRIRAETAKFRLEADSVRTILMARSSPEAQTRVTVFSDSLGLPRPEELQDLHGALDKTYPALILSHLQGVPALEGVSIDSHCQRFFTTDDAVVLMAERPESLEGAHVLVHLGLNDCAVRMFLTDQRLACDLLPKEISEQVVSFARLYRNWLVVAFPEHQYVPLTRFRANLHRMAEMVRTAGGRSLTFCTVIVVPWKFWPGTPGICRNFTSFNLAVMEEARRVGAAVLDVDRLTWQHGNAATLNKDGMHLAHRGHSLLAGAYVKSIFNV